MAAILVCDDEKDIVSALKIYLESDGHHVLEAYSGRQALEILDSSEVALVLMDIMMPGMDGISTVSELRKRSNVPVIFLSAKSEDTDKVLGLNIGADDYITKPFNPVEVLARVRSQLRRYTQLGCSTAAPTSLTVGGLYLDDKAKEVTLDGQPVNLTPTEYDILKLFMTYPDEVLSPNRIYQQVWGGDPFGTEGTVAVHIRHLREKIEINPSDPRYLKVLWGHGYKLESQKGRIK